MRAAILAVGSELLGTDRLDSNSLHLTGILQAHGVEVHEKAVVGDDLASLRAVIGSLHDRSELLLITGGLGPTADDVTRQAVAAAVGRDLFVDEDICTGIARRFAALGLEMPEVNRRQGAVIEGARLLPNSVGTAPGQWVEDAGGHIVLLPGVPAEMRAMAVEHLVPWLARQTGGLALEERTLRIACLPESEVEARIGPVYERFGTAAVTTLAAPGEILLRLHAAGRPGDRRRQLDAFEDLVRSLLGDAVYGAGAEGLESVVGESLRTAGQTLAVAESCTGGGLAERLTALPGASAWMLGGVVAYANAVKESLLDVPAATLAEHGAVSRATALAMAVGVRRRLVADWGVGITGIAGPGGGSEDKPVGTVHVAVEGPRRESRSWELRLPGNREAVRRYAVVWALESLRRALAGLPPPLRGAASPEYSG